MRSTHRVAAFVILLFLALSTPGARAQSTRPSPTRDQRLAYLRKGVEQSIALFEQEQAKPGTKFEARQFTLYAHYVMALDVPGAAEKAAAALKRAMALQETNPNDRHYGEFAAAEG